MQPIFAAAAAMFVALAAHIAAVRMNARPVGGYLASLVAGVVTVLACALFLSSSAERLGDGIAALLLFGSWWFVFLNFAQSAQSSLRVNIIREIQAAGGRLARETLFARYNDENLVRLRLERLTRSGVVVERGGRYFVTSSSALLLARAFRLMKIIALGRPSEFKMDR